MVNIKVPILQKLKDRVTRQQTAPLAQNELQFLKELDDNGNMVVIKGDGAVNNNIASFVIPAGKTYYLLEATISNVGSGNVSGALVIVTGGANVSQKRIDSSGCADVTVKGFSVIGDGVIAIAVRSITGATNHATLTGYTLNTNVIGIRGEANTRGQA